jgi:hypothetical protein
VPFTADVEQLISLSQWTGENVEAIEELETSWRGRINEFM